MKLTRIALVVASVTVLLSYQLRADTSLPAPLPDFMDQSQLAKWTTSQTAQPASNTAPATFYTGKPYVADAGGYIFKYRTYNPEMSRWTSADPSGYPDGTNNQIYAPVPTNDLDNNGLITISGLTTPNLQTDIVTVGTQEYLISAYFAQSYAGSTALAGNMSINTYTAAQSGPGGGGVSISVSIAGTPAAPAGTTYHWLQIVSRSDTNNGTQFIDGGSGSPFYDVANPGAATTTSFYDFPTADFTEATLNNPVWWTGILQYVGDASGSSSLSYYGGFTYGFTISYIPSLAE